MRKAPGIPPEPFFRLCPSWFPSLLQRRDRGFSLRLRGLHVTRLARGFGFLHQRGGLAHAAASRLIAPGNRSRSLSVLTARSLNFLTTRSLHLLTARSLDFLTTRSLHLLTARGLDFLATRSLHFLTARRLDLLARTGQRTRRLNLLPPRHILLCQHLLRLRHLGRAPGLRVRHRRERREERYAHDRR